MSLQSFKQTHELVQIQVVLLLSSSMNVLVIKIRNSMFIKHEDAVALSRSWSEQGHLKAPCFGASDSIFLKSDHSYFAITENNYNVVGDFK